jgi:hypothetical protein
MASDLPNNLQSMTNQQLKDLLKLRDLPVSGKKADLIARLETYGTPDAQGGAGARHLPLMDLDFDLLMDLLCQ